MITSVSAVFIFGFFFRQGAKNICLNSVVWSANSLTNWHPVISCPLRFAPNEKRSGKFIREWLRSLCLDNLFPSNAHKPSYFLSANDVEPRLCRESFKAVLKPSKEDKMSPSLVLTSSYLYVISKQRPVLMSPMCVDLVGAIQGSFAGEPNKKFSLQFVNRGQEMRRPASCQNKHRHYPPWIWKV